MVGLSVVAAVFIVFALSASFLAPRRWPDFPGKNGMSVFIIASLVLFGAMLTAIEVFGVEKPEAAEAAGENGKAPDTEIEVTETDSRISLPTLKKLAEGKYIFVVKNEGQKPHNLEIEGGQASGQTSIDTLQPGESGKLEVQLEAGNYTLYSSEDGDRDNGLTATLSVG
jgi:uncharacterized cupredoxin-like copper-binding protein